MILRKVGKEYVITDPVNRLYYGMNYKQIDNTLAEILTWCEKMFGRGSRNSKSVWRHGWTEKFFTMYFKHENDAMTFMLRWS